MASLTHDKHGYRLDFSIAGKRKCVRLSSLGEDQAERARHHVEVALRAHRRSQPIPVATIDWLYRSAPRHLLTSLASERVVDDRRMLSDAWRAFAASKIGRIGTRRMEQIERTGDELLELLGDVELESITARRLEQWRDGLLAARAGNTVAGKSAIVRQFFRWCVAERLLLASPAGELSAMYRRSERMVEVSGEVVGRLAAAAAEEGDWELQIALLLGRWGGLRAAEILRVRLEHVAPTQRTIAVHETKRAAHGYEVRLVPLFPQLAGPVLERLERAESWELGAEGRPGLLMPVLGGRSPSAMDQRAKRLCERIGIEPWERFWQNMRATRESELMDEFSLKDACKWIGNSPEVAMKHYAMVRREEYERAAGVPASAGMSTGNTGVRDAG